MDMNQFFLKAFFGAVLACSTLTLVQAAPTEVDRIVAIVNSESIASSQLRDRMISVRQNLQKQGLQEQMPSLEDLERQILEQLILERIQLQQARNASI
ncbi:MAG: SurA N-terminal domain-containing protein, partial [Azoarcus sp.]|nr:SurA N-terminal domain-containing protein [Azoarcus sp.]